jgi:hypothetical protein
MRMNQFMPFKTDTSSRFNERSPINIFGVGTPQPKDVIDEHIPAVTTVYGNDHQA